MPSPSIECEAEAGLQIHFIVLILYPAPRTVSVDIQLKYRDDADSMLHDSDRPLQSLFAEYAVWHADKMPGLLISSVRWSHLNLGKYLRDQRS